MTQLFEAGYCSVIVCPKDIVTMGNRASKPLQYKVLSFFRPAHHRQPEKPDFLVLWLHEPVSDMQAIGSNRVDLEKEFLPVAC